MTKRIQRCPWGRNPLNIKHHDDEWGVPCHDDRALCEMLILEGVPAGLSLVDDPGQSRELSPRLRFLRSKRNREIYGHGRPPPCC
jgi:hypothetical protein